MEGLDLDFGLVGLRGPSKRRDVESLSLRRRDGMTAWRRGGTVAWWHGKGTPVPDPVALTNLLRCNPSERWRVGSSLLLPSHKSTSATSLRAATRRTASAYLVGGSG